jgi:hypothetical protein
MASVNFFLIGELLCASEQGREHNAQKNIIVEH